MTPPAKAGLGHSLDARRLVWIAWALLAGLVTVDFVRVLARFSWVYTDFDQVLQWTAAYELLNGRLHEPRFYGQAYNSMVEGWTAAPLVALGLPFSTAVPLVTAALSLAPFVALSACALGLRRPLAALVVVALPLALPLPFTMLSTMPRGFVPGICLASLTAGVALLLTRFRSPSPARLFTIVLAQALAMSLNPNAAVVAGPVLLFLLLRHGRSAKVLAGGCLGLVAGAVLHWLSVVFYTLHPEYVIYGQKLPGLSAFSPVRMVESWAEAGLWLDLVSPALPGGAPWLGALAVAFLALLVARTRRGSPASDGDDALTGPDAAAAWALAAGAGFVLATLGFERVHVGSESLFWPLARSYLGVPALLGFLLVCADRVCADRVCADRVCADRSRPDGRWLRPFVLAVVVLATALFTVRGTQLDTTIERELAVTNPVGVRPWPVQELESRCRALDALAREHGARLVAVGSFEIALTYACEPLVDGDWGTLLVRTVGRRAWRVLEELDSGPRVVLLYGFTEEQVTRLRAAGHRVAPAGTVAGVPVRRMTLPGGMEGFATLAETGMRHARSLHQRAQRLDAARRESAPSDR